MKRLTLILSGMLMAMTLFCQETMTNHHSIVDQSRQSSDQNIMAPDNPVSIPMNPGDLGNPPDKNWVSQFGGDGSDVGQDVITDAAGNSYVTGYFSGPVTFGTESFTSVGYTDGFIAKFNSTGALVWFRQLSCQTFDMVRGFGITLDLQGNVYVTGSFNGATLQIGTYTLMKTGTEDIFIAKYTAAGTLLLASHYGIDGIIQQGKSIAADAEGNFYVIAGGENSYLYGGNSFIKFHIDGNWQWTYNNGAYFTDIQYNNYSPDAVSGAMPSNVSMRASNATEPALYLTGYIIQNTDFGNTTLTATLLRNSPFLARFPTTNIYSDFEWAVQGVTIGTANYAYNRASSLVIDENENIYFSGRFRRKLAFGNDTLNGTYGNSPYIVKCSPSGSFTWARQGTITSWLANSSSYVYPVDITRDPSGNPLITYDLLNDGVTFGSYTLEGMGGGIVKYDLNGNVQWAVGKDFSPKGIYGSADDKLIYTGMVLGNMMLVQDNAMGTEEWSVQSSGNSGSAQVANLELDAQGNLFVYGRSDVATYLSGNSSGTFLAKLKPGGDTLWTVPFKGGYYISEYGNYLAIDQDDNICVMGYYVDTLQIGNNVLINNGAAKVCFIVKFDPSGNVFWLKQIGNGQFFVEPCSIATDAANNVLASGTFSDSLTIGNTRLTDAGYGDAFLSKFDENGNFVWAARAGGDNTEYNGYISTDGLNNIYLTGEFLSRTITVGTQTVHLTSTDGDVALIKFTPGGQMNWFHAYGGGQPDTNDRYNCWPNAIKTDANGNSYIYGWTGPGNLYGSFLLESPYNYNFSLMKINSSGIVQWAKIIKEKQYGWHSQQIDIDGEGNCYIGGYLRDTIYFENNMVVNQGRRDLFAAKYGNSGNFIWAKIFSSNPEGRQGTPYPSNSLNGIAAYDTATVFMAGSTIYDIQFDDTILHGSNSNGFISLYGPDIPVGIPEPGETGNGLTIFPNPAEDYVYFRGSLDTPGASAEIISLGGQTMIIHEFPAVSAQYSVNVHDLSPGMYFIKLKSGNEIRTGKFVKR